MATHRDKSHPLSTSLKPLLAAAAVLLMVAMLGSNAYAQTPAAFESGLTSYGDVTEVNLDSQGRLIIADPGASEMWRVDPSSGAYELFRGQGAEYARPDGTGKIWWTDAINGFGVLDPESAKITRWYLDDSVINYNLGPLAFDDSGAWLTEYIGSTSKLYHFNPLNRQWCAYTIAGGASTYDLIFKDGQLWYANYYTDQVLRFTPTSSLLESWQISGGTPLPTGQVLDASGFWWSDFNGATINKLDPLANTITRYTLPSGQPQDLAKEGDLLWFTDKINGKIGRLDPASAAGSTVSADYNSQTLTPDCITLPAGSVSTITKLTGKLVWGGAAISPTYDQNGWTYYQFAAGAAPNGIAANRLGVYLTDPGRQKLVKLPITPVFNPDYTLYVPAVLGNTP